jgi:hypothetical protein
MTLDEAIGAHAAWRARFQFALSAAPSEQIAECGPSCRTGEWLRGEAQKKFGGLPELKTCMDRHREMHEAARGAVEKILIEHADPTAVAGVNSAFNTACNRAVLSLHGLKEMLTA